MAVNPNSLKNLEEGGFQKRTSEEIKAIASKGGKLSGVAKRQKALFKEIMENILDESIEYDGKVVSKKTAWSYKLIANALGRVNNGNLDEIDLKAFQVIRDTIGEKPKESFTDAGEKLDLLIESLGNKANEIIDEESNESNEEEPEIAKEQNEQQ